MSRGQDRQTKDDQRVEHKFWEISVEDRSRQWCLDLPGLYTIAETGSGLGQLDEAMAKVLDAVLDLLKAEAGGIYLLDKETGELVLRVWRGLSDEFVEEVARLKDGEGIWRRVLQGRSPILIQPFSTDDRLFETQEALQREGIHSTISVPLVAENEIVGVINVMTHTKRKFTSEEATLLSTVGRQIAVALENVRLREDLERKVRELTALYSISLNVTAQLEMQELLQTIVEHATRLLNAKAGGIYLYDPAREEIELQVSYGLSKDYAGTRLALDEGLCGKVAQSGSPLMVSDYQEWEGKAPLWEEEAIGGVLGVPLKHGDNLLGVLFVGHAPGNTFQEGAARLASLFAGQAAIAIENAQLYGATQQELAAEKRAQEALQESEERYRQLLELSPDPIAVHSEGKIVFINKAGVELLGAASLDELIGKPVMDFVHPDYREIIQERMQQMQESGKEAPLIEERFIRLDGTVIDVELAAAPVTYEGKPAVLIVARDITERKQVEEELIRLSSAVKTSIDSIGITDIEGKLIDINEAALKMYGTDNKGDLIGKYFLDLIAPEQREKARVAIEAVLEKGYDRSRDYYIITKDGSRVPVEMSAAVMKDVDGKPIGFVGICRDITERKRAEEEIRRRSNELAALYDVSLDVAAQLEIQQLLQTIVERAIRLLHAKAGGIYLYDPAKHEIELQVSYGLSKDYTGTRLALGEGLSGKVAQTGKPLMVSDYQRWEGRSPLWEGEAIGGVLGVPLKRGDDLLGVLTIDHAPGKTFQKEDVRLATLFANQAAIAIENARLYEEEQRTVSQLRLIREVSQRITSILDLDQLLNKVVSSIKEAFGYHYVAVFLVDPRTEEIVLSAQDGPIIQSAETRLKIGKEGITGWVAQSGEPLLVNDVHQEPRYYFVEELKETKSELAVPIQTAERVIGVLNVESTELDAFDESDLDTLQTLADQLAVAIENARLYEQQRQRLTQMAALRQTTLDITSQLDMSPLLHSIIQRAAKLLGATGGEIHLYDPAEKRLEIVASQGLAVDYTGTKLLLGEGVAGKVVESGEPLIVNDYPNWEGKAPQLGDAPERSIIGVPMKWHNQVIGVLDIIDQSGDKIFDQDDISLLSQFADQAAIAIENARLYEGARKKIDELSSLLMSHELRGPLTNIKAAAQTWESLVSGRDLLQRELVNIVQQESDRLTWFLDTILNIAALETGLATPEWREVSLRSLIAKAADPDWLPQHDHRLEVLVEGELRVKADEGWTVMVIRNLLENAIKHCPPKSHIEVRASRMDEDWGKVTVSDNGEGIAPQDLARIFQKFYRGQNAIERGVTGHGLGLYLVKLLVEAQGGTVWVDSEVGKGTNFSFSIPLAR